MLFAYIYMDRVLARGSPWKSSSCHKPGNTVSALATVSKENYLFAVQGSSILV